MSEETRSSVHLSQGGHTQWSDEAAVAVLAAEGLDPVDHDMVLLYDDVEVVATGRNGAPNTTAWTGFAQACIFLNKQWNQLHYRADGSYWIDLKQA